jgi:hypothetical protein
VHIFDDTWQTVASISRQPMVQVSNTASAPRIPCVLITSRRPSNPAVAGRPVGQQGTAVTWDRRLACLNIRLHGPERPSHRQREMIKKLARPVLWKTETGENDPIIAIWSIHAGPSFRHAGQPFLSHTRDENVKACRPSTYAILSKSIPHVSSCYECRSRPARA